MGNLKNKFLAAAVAGILLAFGCTITMRNAAAQAGPPSSAGPQVTIVNPLPLPVTGSVGVNGTVNIRDVDSAARKPFQKALATGDLFAVPSGQRLTIEFVSSECETQNRSGSFPPRTTFAISTTVGGTTVPHYFQPVFNRPFAFPGTTLVTYFYGSTDQTRIYADPGTTVSLAGTVVDFSCLVSVSGYTTPQ